MTDETSDDENKVAAKLKPKKTGLLAGIRNNFLAGVVVVAPIGITFALIYWLVTGPMAKLDGFVQEVLPDQFSPGSDINLYIPGFGVLVAFVTLILLGAMAKNFVGRTFIRTGDRLLDSMPVVRNLYGFFKNVFEMALQQSERSFEEVALIEYPKEGCWAVCFVVTRTKGELAHKMQDVSPEMASVFLPTTPNPTSGFLLFVPREKLRILNMSVEEGAKLIFSAGLVTPAFSQEELAQVLETEAAEAKTGLFQNLSLPLGKKKDK